MLNDFVFGVEEDLALWPHMSVAENIGFGLREATSLRRAEQNIPLSLHGFDLPEDELEPIKLSSNLRLQVLRYWATITGPEFLKPLPPFAQQGFII